MVIEPTTVIKASFGVDLVVTGRFFFLKFNNSLLLDDQYHNVVKQVMDDTVTQYVCLPYKPQDLMNISKQDGLSLVISYFLRH